MYGILYVLTNRTAGHLILTWNFKVCEKNTRFGLECDVAEMEQWVVVVRWKLKASFRFAAVDSAAPDLLNASHSPVIQSKHTAIQ